MPDLDELTAAAIGAFADSPDFLAAFASLYGGGDDSTQGHLVWRTVGAQQGADGEKHGGTRVQMNKSTGEIEKGPKPMVGKKPSEVGPAMQHAHRREKREGIVRKAAAEHPEPMDEQVTGVIAANHEKAVAKVKAKRTVKPGDDLMAKLKARRQPTLEESADQQEEEDYDKSIPEDGGESESTVATEIPDAHELTPDDYHHRYTRLVNPMATPDESWHEQEKAVADAIERGEDVPDHVRVEFGHPTAADEQAIAEKKGNLPTDEMVAQAMKKFQAAKPRTLDEALADKKPASKDLFGREVLNPIGGDTLPLLHEPVDVKPSAMTGADAKIAKQYDPKATPEMFGAGKSPTPTNTPFVGGDEAKYTGKSERKHGALWHEVEVIGGSRKGTKHLVADPAERSHRDEKTKQDWHEQQAGFRRIREAQEKDKTAKSTEPRKQTHIFSNDTGRQARKSADRMYDSLIAFSEYALSL